MADENAVSEMHGRRDTREDAGRERTKARGGQSTSSVRSLSCTRANGSHGHVVSRSVVGRAVRGGSGLRGAVHLRVELHLREALVFVWRAIDASLMSTRIARPCAQETAQLSPGDGVKV
jgi:hypothetical protein